MERHLDSSLLMPGSEHWSSRIISKIGANANLDRQARALGLEKFISGPLGGKAVADTVEAILGAIYLDSNMEKAKNVVEVLDLLTPERRVERELDLEGFAELNEEDLVGTLPKGRKGLQASQDKLSSDLRPSSKRRRRKNLFRLEYGRVNARFGSAFLLSPESCSTTPAADPSFAKQTDYIEIPD